MQKITLFWVYVCLIYRVYTTDLCHSKCSCHGKVLNCTGLTQNDIKSADFHNSITSNLESIQITGGTITELSQNWLGSCTGDSPYRLDKLKKLDLQDNDIHYIDEKSLHCVPNLEELILANNQWNITRQPFVPVECMSFTFIEYDYRKNYSSEVDVFTSVKYLKKLNLSDAFHDHVDPKVHMCSLRVIFLTMPLNKLEVLALDHNGFTMFVNYCVFAMTTLPSIKILDLSYNSLSELDCLPGTEFLDLSYNNITSFESDRIFRELHGTVAVDFYGNKFNCDCRLGEFHDWLKNTNVHVIRMQELYCHDKKHFNRPIVSLEPSDFICQKEIDSQSTAVTFKQDSEYRSSDVTYPTSNVSFTQDIESQSSDVTCQQDSESRSSDVTFPTNNASLHINHAIGLSTVGIVAIVAVFIVCTTVITIFMMKRCTKPGKLKLKESVMKI